MVYCLVGAGIFWKLERPSEIRKCEEQVKNLRQVHTDYEPIHTDYISLTPDNFTKLFEILVNLDDIDVLEKGHDREYNSSLAGGIEHEQNRIFDHESKEWKEYMISTCTHVWTYENAVYFCFTVISTIGYGNIVPATMGGRLFFIFYCIPGIGIFGVLLSRIQAVFTHVIDSGAVILIVFYIRCSKCTNILGIIREENKAEVDLHDFSIDHFDDFILDDSFSFDIRTWRSVFF